MVRLSTTYDKTINRKIFVVRGDEAYARTTETELVIGTVSTGDLQGLKIASLRVNLYRTVGSALVTIYDGDTIIHSQTITSSTTYITLSNVYLSYGVTHELYAVYTPLQHQCLGSKSKRQTVYNDIPSSLRINFTKNSADTQVNGGASFSFNFTVKKGTSSISNSTDVLVYVDDEYVKTVNPSSNVVSSSVSDIDDGKHTVRLEVATSDSFYGNSYEYTVLVGYQLEILEYPSQFINGTTNNVKVKVSDYNGELKTSGTAYIYRKNVGTSVASATVADTGIATINVTTLPATDEYYSSYGGSKTDNVIFTQYNPNGLTITANPLLIGYDDTSIISINLNENTSGVPVSISAKGSTSQILTELGKATYTYTGSGYGDSTITATVGSTSDSISIVDSLAYWTNKNTHSDLDDILDVIDGDVIEYSNYLAIIDKAKASGSATGISNAYLKFNPPAYVNSSKLFRFKIAKNPLNVTSIEIGTLYQTYYWYPDVEPPLVPTLKSSSMLPLSASQFKKGDVIEFYSGVSPYLKVNDTKIIEPVNVTTKFPHNEVIPIMRINTQDGGELYITDLLMKK